MSSLAEAMVGLSTWFQVLLILLFIVEFIRFFLATSTAAVDKADTGFKKKWDNFMMPKRTLENKERKELYEEIEYLKKLYKDLISYRNLLHAGSMNPQNLRKEFERMGKEINQIVRLTKLEIDDQREIKNLTRHLSKDSELDNMIEHEEGQALNLLKTLQALFIKLGDIALDSRDAEGIIKNLEMIVQKLVQLNEIEYRTVTKEESESR